MKDVKCTMTRQHFAFIAETIKDLRQSMTAGTHIVCARTFAAELSRTNALFNREKFLRACGVADA